MDLRHLQTFVTVAETLHFGAAAEQLRVAQPQVSRRIRQLEEELRAPLFHRDRRHVRLTQAGAVFLADARRLLDDARAARERARETALGRRGRLNLTLVSNAMLGGLPAALADFHRQYPDVTLHFAEVGSGLQLQAVARGACDVAICHPPRAPDPALDRLDFPPEPMVAVVPLGHPLASRAAIALTDLAAEPWIMFPRGDSAPIHDRVMAACQRAGFTPRIVQEAGPIQTRLGLVAAGFGVHLVHRAWRAMPFPGVAYLPIRPITTVRMAAWWRKADPNPMLRLFVGTLGRHLTALPPALAGAA